MGNDNEVSAKFTLEDNVSNALDTIKGNLDLMSVGVVAAFAVAYEAVAKFLEGLNKLVNIAADVQDTQAETVRITEQVGTSSGITAAAIENLSEKVAAHVGLEKDQIQQGMNLLLLNPNIKSGYDQIAQAAADLAAQQNNGKLTQDGYMSSITALSKALENPERAIRMLTSAQVYLSDAQKQAIKDAIAAGDTDKARALILEDIQGKVAGAAEKEGTYNFVKQQAIAATTKLAETIGNFLLPIASKLVTGVKNMIDWFTNLIKSNKDVQNALHITGAVILSIIDVLKGIAITIKDVIMVFVDFGKMITEVMSGNFKNVGQYSQGIIKSVKDIGTTWVQQTKTIIGEFTKQETAQKQHLAKKLAAEKQGNSEDLTAFKQHHADMVADEAKLAADRLAIANSWSKDTKLLTDQLNVDTKKLNDDARAAEQSTQDAALKSQIENEKKASEDKLATAKMEHDQKIEFEKSLQDALGELAQLQNSKNRTLFEIGKQAAVASALVKGAEAIMGFWATCGELGPIAGPIMAGIETAAVAVVTAEQVSSIESQSFPAAAQGALVTPQGGGALVQVGEKAQEAVMNSEMMKEALGAARGGAVNAYFLPSKAHVAAFTGASTQSKARMIKEGRLASGS